MKKKILGVSKPAWLGALAIGLLTPIALWAVVDVDTDTIFEVDGNALSDGNDDWARIATNTDSAMVDTGIIVDPTSPLVDEVFTGGGSKDVRNVSGSGQTWSHQIGSVPDKDNLTHAYAAAYQGVNTDGDLHIYFGADRFDASGAAAVGFWFFKDNVTLNPNGKFNGTHQVGDILITSDFKQGGGVSVINVFQWVGGSNPIQLLATGTPAAPGSGSEPFCLTKNVPGEGVKNIVCAISNRDETDVPSPWPGGYTDKDGNTTEFKISAFFEGGINISELLGVSTTCFSSFLAMTRTSPSTTAQLKDFALGAFPLCGVSVAKSCDGATTISPDGEHFRNNFTVSVTNSGGGPLFDASFIEESVLDADTQCKVTHINGVDVTDEPLSENEEVELAATLAAGATATATVQCDTLDNPFNNRASGKAYLQDTDTFPNAGSVSADTVDSDPACPPFDFLGELIIRKDCAEDETGGLPPVTLPNSPWQPQVCVDIEVTNDRNETVENVTITDDMLDASEIPAPFTLGPKGSATDSMLFEDLCYTPATGDDPNETDPSKITFTDHASAEGTGVLSASTVSSSTVSAECPLCIPHVEEVP